MSLEWKEVSRKSVYNAGIFDLERAVHKGPHGEKFEVSLIQSPDWVNIIPVFIDEKGERYIVLVRQFRHGSMRLSIEIPGGLVDSGETYEVAARRELLEETGWQTDKLIQIGSINPNPAFMTNKVVTFVAEGLIKQVEQNLDEHEFVEVEMIHESKLDELTFSDEFDNGVILSALYWYKMYRASSGTT